MSQKKKASAALALRSRLMLLLLVVGIAAGCGGRPDAPGASPCTPPDSALEGAAFVIATTPRAGEAVTSGFAVRGCSRTFESNVQWQLTDRKGRVLARGFTSGGGVEGGKPFAFVVDFQVSERQLGYLEVSAPRVSETEGFPPGRTVLPLVLVPGPP